MIIIIAAVAENGIIGNNNQLIWRLPNDLKRFKKFTSGCPIIMGRKTFTSLGKPLPNRTNIVVTRDQEWKSEQDIIIVHSLEESVEIAQKINPDVYVIGGGEIYKQAMKLSDRLEITEVHHSFEGDVSFPKIDTELWTEVEREEQPSDEQHAHRYAFVRYQRK